MFVPLLILLGCTSVRENPPQLTTDTTGHELANRNCIFFCSVTGTFTGSASRASNTGSARSTDSSSFAPDVKPTNTLRAAPKREPGKSGKPRAVPRKGD